MKKSKYILAITTIVLLLLVFQSGVLASEFLLTIGDNTPKTNIDILIQSPPSQSETSESTSSNSSSSSNTTNNNANNQTPPTSNGPENNIVSRPGVEVSDANGIWNSNTKVELFKAEYENESGEITVKSAYGDFVIAPGTSNRYYFDIRNTGNTPIKYTITTEAHIEFHLNNEDIKIPIQAKFYDSTGKYFVGTENSFADMELLHGINETEGLSENHYIRYTLDWQWPFEGDDELDTLIGNMATLDDEVSITIVINIVAMQDGEASGGAPSTGDSSNVAFWMTIGVCSLCILILLLFPSRKEEDEEEIA